MTAAWSHRVEHVDTDASGVVHFARFVSMVETLSLEFLHENGIRLLDLSAAGLDLAVAEAHLHYRASARHRDVVTGDAWVDQVGGAAFTLDTRLVRAGTGGPTYLATGRLRFAVVHTGSGSAQPLPTSVRSTLKELLRHDR